MGKAFRVGLGFVVVAGVAVGGYYLFQLAMAKKTEVDETVADVQARLDELDPVTRAAAVAKLTADEAKSLKGSRA